MAATETVAALRGAIFNHVQASIKNALAERLGLDEVPRTEKRMLVTGAALEAAIDASALTLAADMVEGLRQIMNMIDAPHFGEDRKCRIRNMASDLVSRAEALNFGQKSRDYES